MLSTTHLQTFVAVVEAGSYSAAARKLHMTQPAVSQHIRTLEIQLGEEIKLFRRVGQKMKLTQVGEALLVATRDLLTLAERTEDQIKAMRGHVAGRVVVGRTPAFGERYLPPLLSQFLASFPMVTIALLVQGNDALLDMVTRHQIDLALVDEVQQRRGLQIQLLGSEEVLPIVPRGHHLLQHVPVVPGMLRDNPLIVPLPMSALRRGIDDALRRRGEHTTELRVVLETDDTPTVLQAVRSGLGVGFVPAAALLSFSDLEPLSVQSLRLIQEWYIVRLREHTMTRAAHELFSLITSRQGQHTLGQEGFQANAVEH